MLFERLSNPNTYFYILDNIEGERRKTKTKIEKGSALNYKLRYIGLRAHLCNPPIGLI